MIKNYQIFRETINSTIKNSGLDIGIVYFILKSIFPSGLWTSDLVQVRMMTTQRKVLGHSETNASIIENIRGRNPLTNLSTLAF